MMLISRLLSQRSS